jgi:2-polyprenyl-3-methyl-5-hydroxy-6-metoxy-1,4-benzoquinol methylase/Tfp pilus assembly protein PilF
MNRRERRAAEKAGSGSGQRPTGAPVDSPLVVSMYAAAAEHHRAGRVAAAQAACNAVLATEPKHIGSLYLLGLIAQQAGRADVAIGFFARAIAANGRIPEVHAQLGLACRAAGRLDEAVRHYRRALALNPGLMSAHYNLGNALREQGKLDEAAASYRHAITLDAKAAEPCNNLGTTLMAQGFLDEAAAQFRQALALKPDQVESYNNLCRVHLARRDLDQALAAVRRALAIGGTSASKGLFVQCLSGIKSVGDGRGLAELVVCAIAEGWGRPGDLAGACAALLRLNDPINRAVERAAGAWPTRPGWGELATQAELCALAADPVFHALMTSAPVCDVALERFLTTLRKAMLDATADCIAVNDGLLPLACALARQCFINEYVFDRTDDEERRALALRDQLAAAAAAVADIPDLWPAVVAAYFPLHAVPGADLLGERAWAPDIAALVTQQIREPREEQQIRRTIPQLTAIEDEISLRVRQQYEENPYPRWLRVAAVAEPVTIEQQLRRQFPFARIRAREQRHDLDVLIAGCGTGQQPIETARELAGARVLALDLSLASLSYAERKTRELGLRNIEYAQADLLKLGTLGRTFDVIAATGVLHHLADPNAGLRVLRSLLRPRGFMRIGLYSARARAAISAARTYIAERNYGSAAADIRRCRADLMSHDLSAANAVVNDPDFFTTSTCRDLLFHVQEHRFRLPEIHKLLDENRLEFLAFDVDSFVTQRFRARFGNAALGALTHWHTFEEENPTTFAGMYIFWAQAA